MGAKDEDEKQEDHRSKVTHQIHRSRSRHKKHHRTKHRKAQGDDEDTVVEITVTNLKIHDEDNNMSILVAYVPQQRRGTAIPFRDAEEQVQEAARAVQRLLRECDVHGRVIIMYSKDPAVMEIADTLIKQQPEDIAATRMHLMPACRAGHLN